MPTYKEKWGHAKDVFKATTKVKKPSAKVDSTFRKSPGLDKILAEADLAEKTMSDDPKGLAALKLAAGKFKTAKEAYMKVLEATVGAEPVSTDKVVYQKGIAVLKAELNALEASIQTSTAMRTSSVGGAKGLALMADNLMHLVNSACHNAHAFIARARAQPSAEYFNSNIQKAARDITQNIGNVNKLKDKGFHFHHVQPDNLFTILAAWGNKGRRVPTTANAQEVLREVGAFEQAVVGVEKWASGEYVPH